MRTTITERDYARAAFAEGLAAVAAAERMAREDAAAIAAEMADFDAAMKAECRADFAYGQRTGDWSDFNRWPSDARRQIERAA